jgi:predicted nuclease of restriction endonuclease-like (RecB) superfamily
MASELIRPDYGQWLSDLKGRIHQAQQRASLAVNHELIELYWQLGRDILARQSEQGWGAKVIERLSRDLRSSFPEMKGFSRANLLYMRAFAEAWPDFSIVQQAVGRLPWGHNIVLLTRLKDMDWRLAYARSAIEYGWSRNVLNLHIESSRLEREGKAITNFDLLFYHLKLRCYLVIELKAGPFKPEHTGKLGFYLSAVDAQIKHADDQPTIGLLLCKSKNQVVAEYALRDSNKSIGVAEYQLVQSLPEKLQTKLTSIEEIEAELADETFPDEMEEGGGG